MALGTHPLSAVAGVVVHRPLGELTTYKFGGPARWFAEPGDVASLRQLLATARQTEVPWVVLGRGSNVVIADSGYPGLVVRLGGGFQEVAIDGDGVVTAGGAVPLPKLARAVAAADRGGLEFYVGIPGSVGGAVRMNAGGHGSDTAQWLVDATILDAGGRIELRDVAALDLGYRHSNLGEGEIVVGARFRTVARPRGESEQLMREITQWRKEHQPGGTFNAGSVFKNPPGDHAGRIIDSLGLKGFRVGGASVSTRHANFFVADDTATAQDVHDLVVAVQQQVREATGIVLEPEIRFIGPFSPPHPHTRAGSPS